jgi:hypothetical protein
MSSQAVEEFCSENLYVEREFDLFLSSFSTHLSFTPLGSIDSG